MNGIRLLNLRAKKLEHLKRLNNKINAVYIHTDLVPYPENHKDQQHLTNKELLLKRKLKENKNGIDQL